ncbi:DUF7669 domain-containing protein [Deinococcus hopiensis]|uniref:DUF7669 domain-containing protein n=1 Tax=Deinococcus hopiensis KR-140 TaxID=695939 RepID=A0A1W1UQI1_9DEIO|nr:hypothetical protein [Deinococcus hopiensis]SMB83362.1 hypothetical protein SAMN00790413_04388 [Deinococcus hopiensis KR-140]
MKTCREEVLAVARILVKQRADGTFTAQEIVAAMREYGTKHLDTTIRRHVSTEMCINAVGPNAAKYHDFERVERGRFKLL